MDTKKTSDGNMMDRPDASERGETSWTGSAAVLWASAFILMALIITQAGRLGGPVSPAHADVTSAGDLTIITTQGSSGEDLVAVLDRRDDLLLIYGIDSSRRIELLRFYSVQQLFSDLGGRRGGGQQR